MNACFAYENSFSEESDEEKNQDGITALKPLTEYW